MKHTIGGLGNRAKVVFYEDRGLLRIWEKGFIGKRHYRVKVDQVSTVTFGWYTSRIRLPMRGFNIEFQHKGKTVVVTVPGDHKRLVPRAHAAVRAIGHSAGLTEYSVQGADVIFSRTNPGGTPVQEAARLAPDGSPMTNTEQVISAAARGTKNVAGEIASDAANSMSRGGKILLTTVGVFFFFGLLGSNPVIALLFLAVCIFIYRRNR